MMRVGQERQGCMHSYAFWWPGHKYPEIKELIIIATEPKDAGSIWISIYFNT